MRDIVQLQMRLKMRLFRRFIFYWRRELTNQAESAMFNAGPVMDGAPGVVTLPSSCFASETCKAVRWTLAYSSVLSWKGRFVRAARTSGGDDHANTFVGSRPGNF